VKRALLAVLLTAATLVPGLGAPPPASAATVNKPLIVVLCKFTDLTTEPHAPAYYEAMFGEAGAGQKGVFDYWKDVSYGAISLAATKVKGWYTISDTKVADWNAKARRDRIDLCASQAKDDVNFADFAGVVVLTNQSGFQEDLFGGGPPTAIAGTTYANLGLMLAEEDQTMQYVLHESGHSLGLKHSRALSRMTPTSTQSDYGDDYDVMSCESCFNGVASYQGDGGPGLNVVQLDTAGWLPAARGFRSFDTATCKQQTIPMAALNHPEAPGYLEARIPASIPISFASTQLTTSDHYTVELRSKSGWDVGIPDHTTLIHLHGQDGYSYWVDTNAVGQYYRPPGVARGAAGTEYVDTARKAYVTVNAIAATGETATVTLGSCRIKTALAYTGATTGDFGDRVTLSADVRVAGTNAPAPYRTVTLRLGTQSCTADADVDGRARCDVVIDQPAGQLTAGASFAGDPAYDAGSTSAAFTVTKEQTAIAYTGATTSDYHDPFEASATLTEPDGPVPATPVTFTLGSGDTCTATTDPSGRAACPITPTQPAGAVTVTAAFAGDGGYLGATDARPFQITRQETTATYTGPLVIASGQPVTLEGRLVEESGPVPVEGRPLRLALGTQACTGTTDATGTATCVLAGVAVPLGPQPLSAAFAGDAYYEPSSDGSRQAIVFAFPSRGAFTVGDRSAAASARVTWWSAEWSTHNALTGGPAPASFKGFAANVGTAPPSCGATWTSSPGNSPPPTAEVPSYMGVVVTGATSTSGSRISGDVAGIVVVRTDPGYAPNPGHPGTGTIVATYCP
jgi:hypothetical protein